LSAIALKPPKRFTAEHAETAEKKRRSQIPQIPQMKRRKGFGLKPEHKTGNPTAKNAKGREKRPREEGNWGGSRKTGDLAAAIFQSPW
jgi:hypothetical protein